MTTTIHMSRRTDWDPLDLDQSIPGRPIEHDLSRNMSLVLWYSREKESKEREDWPWWKRLITKRQW